MRSVREASHAMRSGCSDGSRPSLCGTCVTVARTSRPMSSWAAVIAAWVWGACRRAQDMYSAVRLPAARMHASNSRTFSAPSAADSSPRQGRVVVAPQITNLTISFHGECFLVLYFKRKVEHVFGAERVKALLRASRMMAPSARTIREARVFPQAMAASQRS